MKWIAGLFLLLVLVVMTCCESRAAVDGQVVSSVATTETFTLSKGMTLWEIASTQKLPRHDWPDYWKDTCALSQITCTDDAWRKLPVGTVITAPRDLRVVLAERKAELSALRAKIATQKQNLVELRQSLTEAKNAQEEQRRALQYFLLSIGITGIVFLGLIGIMLFVYHRMKSNETINRSTREVTEGPHGLFAAQDAYPPPTHTPPLKAAYPGSSRPLA